MFRRPLLIASVAFVVSACWTRGQVAAPKYEPVLIMGQLAHPTRILARRAAPTGEFAQAAALSTTGMRVVHTSALVPGLVVLEPERAIVAAQATVGATTAQAPAPLPADEALLARIEALRATGLYDYVEPDYLVFADAVPNDTAFTDGMLWGLRNTGQSGGVAGVDIGAAAAWDITTGSTGVTVAVIDSGIRATHVDLAAQMWRNPGEIAGNGRDDDGNGYIDDVHGINAIAHSGNPSDDEGHGTHVAGTIGAAANDGHGMVGVAWRIRLMACKFLNAEGEGTTSDAIECVSYATAKGARILNISWGSTVYSQSLFDSLAAARAAGVLVVASAGNDSINTDSSPHYPSCYDLDNIISVAAMDRWGTLAGFSNYGVHSVDLAAPGYDIYSTLHDSDTSYGSKNGTSMAAPHVAGVAALVLAAEPAITLTHLRNRLILTAVPSGNFVNYVAGGGWLHAHRALTLMPDGELELAIAPPESTTLVAGTDLVVTVGVTDLAPVRDATVTAAVSTGASLTFRDDGMAPDTIANDANYTASIAVPRGQSQLTFDFSVAAPGKTTATVRRTFTIDPPPANDTFAARATLSGAEATIVGSNRGASVEAGEPEHAGKPGGASVWWTWTAPGDGLVTIQTGGSTFNTLLGVYTGTAVNALVPVASSDDYSGYGPSRVDFAVRQGSTYQIAVDGLNGAVGSIQLYLHVSASVANDRFDQAIALSGSSVSISGSTLNCTLEPGEPGYVSGSSTEGSVWWVWTAPSDGVATVRSRIGTSLGPMLAVYAGDRIDALVGAPGRASDASGSDRAVTFGAVAGQSYRIAAYRSYWSGGGDFTLLLDLAPGPANDQFVRRIPVVGDEVTIEGNLTGASREPGEPGLPGPGQGTTLWWSWTPVSSGTARLLTTGSIGWPTIGVFSGDAVSALRGIAADLDGVGEPAFARVEWRVVGGTAYHLVADSYLTTSAVRMAIQVLPAPVNDDFANRIHLSGTSLDVTGNNEGASLEPGEPVVMSQPQGGFSANATLWWSWVAPADGTAVFEGGSVLAVLTGSTLGELAPVPDADQTMFAAPRLVTRVTAGVQYQIMRGTSAYWRGDLPFTVRWHPAPANDMFADRAVLTGATVALTGDAAAATIEPGEPDGPHYQQKGTLWWTWIAPITSTVVCTTTTTQGFAVYTGNALASLTTVHAQATMGPGSSGVQFSATAGQAYQVAVSPTVAGSNPVSVQLSCVVPPGNDNFAQRATLTGRTGSASGTTVGATRETGEPYTGAGRSVWWRWTAPADGIASFSVAGSAVDAIVRAWEGDAVGGLTLAAEGQFDTSTESATSAVWVVRAGATYQISVDVLRGLSGPVALAYELVPVPANDTFAQRAFLSGNSFSTTTDNLGATAEPGEVSVVPYSSAGSTLWWKWVAPARGSLEVTTSASGPRIGVFRGTVVSLLARQLDADDAASRAVVHVEPGVEYQIAVETGGARYGVYTLSGTLHPGPVNDMFADRIALPGSGASVDGRTTLGTAEQVEPSHGGSDTSASVWWTWTAPKSGTTVLTTRETSGFHYLVVYTGPDTMQLTRVASASGEGALGAGLTFEAIAGTTYQIVVAEASHGPTAFRLRLLQPEIAANDGFAARIMLPGSSGSVQGDSTGAGIEPGENHAGSGYQARASVWWTWTAPSAGTATFAVRGAETGWRRLRAYTGSDLASLTAVPNAFRDDQPSLRFRAEAGVTYQVAFFDTHWSAVGDAFAFDYSIEPGPANDMFADATVVTSASARFEGVGTLATREHGEYPLAYGGTTASLWWAWTVPRSGMANLHLDPQDKGASLVLATGSQVAGLRVIDERTGGPGAPVMIRCPVTAGTTYRIRVDSHRGALDGFSLDLGISEPPANDAFASKAELTGADASASADNRGATAEGGEPYLGTGYQAHASVWWTWTAPASGRAVVTTRGSSIRTMIAVYTGSALGALTSVGSAIEAETIPTGNNVVFEAVKDTTYAISVDGYAEAVGDIELRVVMVSPPVNDAFAGRLALDGESAVGEVDSFGATRQPGEPQHDLTPFGRTLWWSWTAPRSGHVRLRTSGSEIDTLAAVYTGAAVDQLTFVDRQVPSGLPAGHRAVDMDLEVVAGRTYQVAVQGFGVAMGGVRLSLAMYQAPQVQFAVPEGGFVAGQASEITATVSDGPVLAYQWLRDGVELPGATGATLRFTSLQGFHAGAYALRITTRYFTITSDPIRVDPPPPPTTGARVLNLSTRALCQTGENVLIPGFYIEGTGTTRLLMRAVGPELARFGVAGALPDPELVLRRTSDKVVLGTNDNWGDGPAEDIRAAARAVYAFGLTDGSKSAALLLDLPAGGYTITASGRDDTTGVSIVELYEVGRSTGSTRLVNLSNRGHVGAGGNIMIPGFVVSEEGTRTFLVRVVGPSLSRFGVQGVLADPKLEVYRRRPGTAIDDLILANDTWGENGDAAAIKSMATAVQAFSLLEGSADAAFVVTLPPGAYTVNAKGVGDSTGVALVEVYLVP